MSTRNRLRPRKRLTLCGEALERRHLLSGVPELVLDINRDIDSPQISELTDANGNSFFLLDQPETGLELWTSDGRPEGTHLVKDIVPGPGSASVNTLAAFHGRLYFKTAACEGNVCREALWASDGTEEGTIELQSVVNGSVTVIPDPSSPFPFIAVTSPAGSSLWITDGTREGTRLVNQLSKNQEYLAGAVVDQKHVVLWLNSCNAYCTSTIWSSDGTEQNTRQLFVSDRDTSVGAVSASEGKIFFSTSLCSVACTSRLESMDWDGGSRAELLDLRDSWLGEFRTVDDRIWFTVTDPLGRTRLWTSDGTTDGTLQLPGPDRYMRWSFPYDGKLVMLVDSGTSRSKIWVSDGTADGTQVIYEGNRNSYIQLIDAIGDSLYFTDQSSALWTSDGTADGTRQLYRAEPTSTISLPIEMDDVLYFTAQTCDPSCSTQLLKMDNVLAETRSTVAQFDAVDQIVSSTGHLILIAQAGNEGRRVWAMDADTYETTALTEVGRRTEDALRFNCWWWCVPSQHALFEQAGELYFAAAEKTAEGFHLWKTDGTTLGTLQLSNVDIWPRERSDPLPFTPDYAPFFVASGGNSGRELWTADGTEQGTRQVADIGPGTNGSYPELLGSVEDKILFTASDGITDRSLWVSDGSEAGTHIIKQRAAADIYDRRVIGTADGRLLFAMSDEETGEELWISDGTQSGTRLVADIFPGSAGSSPRQLTPAGDRVYFIANDGQGDKLWALDGADADTAAIQPITGNSDIRNIGDVYAVNDLIYFVGEQNDRGRELWVTDGNYLGATLVRDIHLGRNGSYPDILAASAGLLFFVADDGRSGRDLWLTDGTDGGTIPLKDFAEDSYIDGQFAIAFDGELYFPAYDPQHGQEWWKTDGTPEGTVMVADLNPGPAGSEPEPLGIFSDSLLFSADDGLHGRELWAIRGSATSQRYPTDLSITRMRDNSRVSPGQLVTYTVVVANQGPQPVADAVVTQSFPNQLLNPAWTCTAAVGSRCASSGQGDIHDTVDLPVGGTVTYRVSSILDPAAVPGTVLRARATVATPSGLSDLNPANSTQWQNDIIGRVEARWDGSAPVGEPGDGHSWDDARNWSVGLQSDRGPYDSEPNVNLVFPSVSADQPANMEIELGGDRQASDLYFGADYTLHGNSLTLGTGFVSVVDGAQATIHAEIKAPRGLAKRDLGTLVVERIVGNVQVDAGTLAIHGSARDTTVGRGTLAGHGTLAQLTVTSAGTVAPDAGKTFSVSSQATIDGTVIAKVTRNTPIAIQSTRTTRLGDDSVLQLHATESLGSPGHALLPVVRGSSVRGSFADIPHQHIGYGVFTVLFPNSTTSLSQTTNTIWVALLQAEPGDANGDGRFNQLDIVELLQAGTYLTNQPTDWTEGDWNLDGVFDQQDLVAALRTQSYATGTDLVVSVQDWPAAVAPGYPLSGTITITNEGPLPATSAMVTQLFPPEWIDPRWTCVASIDSVCTAHGQGDLMDTVVLPAGGSVRYTLTGLLDFSAQPGESLMMSASVQMSSTLPDIRPDNNARFSRFQVLPIVAHWDGDEPIGVPGDGRSWNDASNWSIGLVSDVAPSSQAPEVDLVFGDTSAVDDILLGQDRHARSLRFDANQPLAGNRLILEGKDVAVAPGVTATIRSELQARSGVNKIGAGTLIVDTLTGDALVQEGTLVLEGSGGNLGVSSGELVVNGTVGDVAVTGGTVRGPGSMRNLTVGSSATAVVASDGPTVVNGNAQIDGTLRAELTAQRPPLLSVSNRVALGPESVLQLQAIQPLGRPGEVFVIQMVAGYSLVGRFAVAPSQHIGFGAFTREIQDTDSFLVYTNGSIWASLYQAEPGDADGSGTMDRHDLVQVLQAGKYASEQQADWTEGDFNGDGRFDAFDVVEALATRQ